MDDTHALDDRLDELVARYSDDLERGDARPRAAYLAEVPPAARPGLERCLKMIEAGAARTPGAAHPLVPGLALDQYELVREVGRGGMALVWLARDRELDRPVALKILRPGLALEQRHADRFRREALAVARLRHPHVVQIHGAGEAQGYHYLAMEFVAGPSLATALEALPTDREPTAADLARATGIPALGADGRDFEQAVALLVAPLAEALQAAHDLGLVHRDVKPSNVLIHSDGRAVLADFGLAKGGDDPALSLTGDALGTPYYMSPEQAFVSGHTVDHRTDIYSLGVTLYEALAGRRPFDGDSFLEVLESIRATVPPAVRALRPSLSRNASEVVRRCMARDPAQRYASARALHADLDALADGAPTAALRAAGGPLRRLLSELAVMASGQPYEYVSGRRLLGLPLVHVVTGRRYPGQRLRVAKGWFAYGDVGIGVVAGGVVSAGVFTLGAASLGLVTWAALGVGGFVFAGLGVGLVSFAGVSAGVIAVGGMAFGYGAVGGMARGHYAIGGSAHGDYVVSGMRKDQECLDFFHALLPSFLDFGS
ncbi:MAG: serine/threonine protein kinase [Planctomycetes bacterium]|nr:serine/threonine protein kinase [Planctomycetota bacterium]